MNSADNHFGVFLAVALRDVVGAIDIARECGDTDQVGFLILKIDKIFVDDFNIPVIRCHSGNIGQSQRCESGNAAHEVTAFFPYRIDQYEFWHDVSLMFVVHGAAFAGRGRHEQRTPFGR